MLIACKLCRPAASNTAPFRTTSRTSHMRRRATAQQAQCSQQAANLLMAGREKHDRGDRMGAVMLYEKALKKDPTVQQRQAALYNSTCAHAFAGDVEFAQVTLRDAIVAGLDLEATLKDPDAVKLQASQQVIIQLRKFAEKVQKSRTKPAAASDSAPAPQSTSSTSGKRLSFDSDVSQLLSTDMTGLDTSIAGVVKRVALLLLVLIALGVGLFFVGYKYTFSSGQQ